MSGQRTQLLGTASQWGALGLATLLGVALFAFVDLSPRIEADFFFSSEDPQLQGSRRIEREFGQAPQVLVAAHAPTIASGDYVRRVYALTEDLQRVPGVADVRSVSHGPKDSQKSLDEPALEIFKDLDGRPFWRRLLLAPDGSSTFVVLRLDPDAGAGTIFDIDRILDRHRHQAFHLAASGVPYVSEHIREHLNSDLRRFSIAAFIAFALLVGVLFRSLAVVVGTMVASLSASFGTFLLRALLGMRGDILMPNLWTIAFVLTLSHVVYLTAQWQQLSTNGGHHEAVREAIRRTGPASAWSLAANLLGFASLMFVSAQPLRQFGISGAIAAGLAMICAYTLFPPFLHAARPRPIRVGAIDSWLDRFVRTRHGLVAGIAIGIALVLTPFVSRVNTDPALPSYFGEGDPIRTGIEAIDRAGGSSSLEIVVADRANRPFDDGDMVKRLESLHREIEQHPDVGAVLSIAPLMGEADRPWYAFLFSWEARLDQLDSAKNARVGRTFVSEDRRRGRFILRMRESARSRPRAEVISDITAVVRARGFQTVVVGGLYPLQGELSTLVEGSVIRGLGGLLAALFVMVLVVTRRLRTALAMVVCLAMTPLTLFGLVGAFRMPLDIIAAPAANVALPLGIDEMIHLGYAVRRSKRSGDDDWAAWQRALSTLWRPILISMLVVVSGFSLFLLSSFPPTQRLGVLVCVGAMMTDLAILVVLPAVATWGRRRRKSPPR